MDETPQHALTRYRDSKGLTLEAFAILIGAGKGMVWKWENGKAIPRPNYMQKIAAETGGTVTANDWYGIVTEAAE
jgi:transcriptional regulator with XRE-family HTH domain